jgi:hypothetical protein
MKKRRQPSAVQHKDVPFAGILMGVAGGSTMWLIAALLAWVLTH